MDANYAGSAEKIGQTAKDKLSDFAQAASEKFEKGRGGTADTLESAATAVRAKGGAAGAAIADLSGKAATNLDSSARFVRNADLGHVWSDMGAAAHRHPGAIAFGAVLAGFFMGRMMTRHKRTQVQDT